MKTALRSKNVLSPDGMKDAAIVIEDGIIRDVLEYPVDIEFEMTDYGELIIMPGLIDTHVHINEPGRTDWEGFETATKSAAAGGIRAGTAGLAGSAADFKSGAPPNPRRSDGTGRPHRQL